jgi:hypothetical protein
MNSNNKGKRVKWLVELYGGIATDYDCEECLENIIKQLSEFIERLEGDICDVRNWTDKDSVESARQASRALRDMRTHLNTQVGKQVNPNEYE